MAILVFELKHGLTVGSGADAETHYEVELRELGIGVDVRYSVREEECQIEIPRVSVPRTHSMELTVDEPGVLGQIRAARVDIALG